MLETVSFLYQFHLQIRCTGTASGMHAHKTDAMLLKLSQKLPAQPGLVFVVFLLLEELGQKVVIPAVNIACISSLIKCTNEQSLSWDPTDSKGHGSERVGRTWRAVCPNPAL